LPTIDEHFAVKPLLDSLRAECGDAQFGYRMQGLFAHTLMRLGASILEVNAQGHPDVKARIADELLLAQVKSAQHRGPCSVFQLSGSDLAGIAPGEHAIGYLAFLDCADPVSWFLVDFNVARQFLNHAVPIAVLRAAQQRQISDDCTAEFVEMILSLKARLNRLTFPLLARRAIEGSRI